MNKFFTKSVISIMVMFATIALPMLAIAAESTSTSENPCKAEKGEIYVELNEALGTTKCIKGEGGVSFLKNYISEIYVYGAGLVGLVAVFSIVVGGIQLIVAGDSQNSEVKERITKSFIGIAILFLSALILYTINPTFYVLQ